MNYEFFRKGTSDWRVKNLKLKYTRMITCYSALLYISATYRLRATVTPADIAQLSEFTPLERLEQFARGGMFEALPEIEALTSHAQKALGDYGEFLEFVQEKGAAIKALKKDESTWRKRSYEFGATVAQMLHMISGSDPLDNRVYRSILV